MIVRKNAKSLSPQEKTAFTKAVLALKRKPGTLRPETNQSRYDDYVEVHLNAMNSMDSSLLNWGHQSSAFAPWHRGLLAHFESDLRAIDQSVSLPYWDWTDPSCTSAIFAPDFLGGNGRASDGQVMDGPFAFSTGDWTVVIKDASDDPLPDFLYRQFGADVTAKALPTSSDQAKTMNMNIYDVAPWHDKQRTRSQMMQAIDTYFRPSLEVDLHNLVHRYVGGNMDWAASPNDPVFFLHHCNLDRLWSLWEQTKGAAAPYAPTHNGPPGQSGDSNLIYHAQGDPSPWLGDIRPEDLYDSRRQLRIGYDTDDASASEPLVRQMREPSSTRMPMSPRMMYPLRSEIATMRTTVRERFPLRQDISES